MPDNPHNGWSGRWSILLTFVVVVYLHNTIPLLSMLPRVNVDEPWLMERAFQVMRTGVPSQPMLGLHHAYLLQPGYSYLLAPWMKLFGVGIWQARLLGVFLGLGIVLMIAGIGARLLGPAVGVMAALFLAVDTNFLGGVRNARTDIPSVFFVAVALSAYIAARRKTAVAHGTKRGLTRNGYLIASGAAAGLAMLCHGNAFWIVMVLGLWLVVDAWALQLAIEGSHWRELATTTVCFASGLALTFGPYLLLVLARWQEVRAQIDSFAGDRVPGLSPSFLIQQLAREAQRYKNWYFGLITNLVPNPILQVFQAATALGGVYLVASLVRRNGRGPTRATRMLLAVLFFGSIAIFAAFVNNKAHVYLPHLLLGFSLVAGLFVSDLASAVALLFKHLTRSRLSLGGGSLVACFVLAYGVAGMVYYEKWYSTSRKTELHPYEETAATVLALASSEPKHVFAAPQFWVPFAETPGIDFVSYAGDQPTLDAEGVGDPPSTRDGRPILVLVDESQWKPELTGSQPSLSASWRSAWTRYLADRCSLHAFAPGTAYGTIAAYDCGSFRGQPSPEPFVVGGSMRFKIAEVAWRQAASDLLSWTRYQDPRRSSPVEQSSITTEDGSLHISGDQWPGITTYVPVQRGERYLVEYDASDVRPGDLLYLGRWDRREVETLSGGSSSGIVVPLEARSWFPTAQGFIPTADQIRLLLYSEASMTDFRIRSLSLYRLAPVDPSLRQ